MDVWLRYLSVTAVVFSLASCNQVIDAQPYFRGSFVGTYQPGNPEENYADNLYLPRQPIIVQSRLVSVTPTRYNFTGTVNLNGRVYAMTGYEESKDGDLTYLQPQATPVFGSYLMNLNAGADTSFAICGAIFYGTSDFYASPENPRFFDGDVISGAATSLDDCNLRYKAIVGTIYDLEKR